mgnify:FL=1
MDDKKKQALKFGVYVFIILAVLTIGEYFIAVAGLPWWTALYGIAILKACFVIQHYMHLPRLFGEEEKH